jgi:hypothetical protein
VIATAPVPVVTFAQLPSGWRSFGGAGGAYATSWPYRPDSAGWASALPLNGIVVQVYFFPGDQRTTCNRPRPLVLPARPSTLLEGTRDTPEYRMTSCVQGGRVQVWVDIRNPHPTRALRRVAQAVVTAIRFH